MNRTQWFLKNATPDFLSTLSPEELRLVESMMEEEDSSGRNTRGGMIGALIDPKTRSKAIENFDIRGPVSDFTEAVRPFLPGPASARGASEKKREQAGLLASLGRLGLGAAAELTPSQRQSPAGAVLPTTEDQGLFRQVVQEEGKRLTDAETFVEDPARALGTLSAIASPVKGLGAAGKTGEALRSVSRAGELADPIVAAGKGVSMLAKGAAKAVPSITKTIAELLGLTTGKGAPSTRAMLEIGEESAAARRRLGDAPFEGAGSAGQADAIAARQDLAVRRGILEEDPATLGLEAAAELKGEWKNLGDVKSSFMEEAGDIDISGLKADLIGDIGFDRRGEGGLLREMGIELEYNPHSGKILVREPGAEFMPDWSPPGPRGTSTRIDIKIPENFRAADAGKIETQLKKLLEGPDVISAKELDLIKQGLDDAPAPSPQAGEAIGKIRRGMREKLSEIEGFDEVSDPIHSFRLDLEGVPSGPKKKVGIEAGLGSGELVPKGRKTVNPSKLTDVFTRSFESDPQLRGKQKYLKELDKKVKDTDIRSRAVGQRFQELQPAGLVGRNEFIQRMSSLIAPAAVFGTAVTGAGATAGAGAAILAGLVTLPLVAIAFMPKLAARSLLRLGVAQEKLGHVQRLAQQIAKQAQQQGIGINRTVTLGQVLGRMPEDPEEEDVPSLMSKIGSASLVPGQTAQVRPRKLNEPGLSLGDPFAPSR